LLQIGINFPKGFYLTFHPNFSISKDGIFFILNRSCSLYYPLLIIWARLLGIMEACLFSISLPFMLIIYVFTFLICFLIIVFLWPFYFIHSSKLKQFYKKSCIYFLCTFISL